MLKYRLISAFVLIAAVVAILFLLPPEGFAITTLLVCMLAAWEWGPLSGFSSRWQRVWLAILCGLLLVLMWLAQPGYPISVNMPLVTGFLWLALAWWLLALVLVLYYPASACFWRQSKIWRLLFGALTIVPFFWSMVVLRNWHYNEAHYNGAIWLLYVMILVWGADSGAYLFGKLFGRHKLAPKVSPGKTWQGLIGGLFTSAVIAYLFDMLVFTRWVNLNVAPVVLVVCSVVAALASVLGDLTESMLKREAGVKDSSQLIPGHGGVLDRIDSLMAAMPVFVCLLLLVFCLF